MKRNDELALVIRLACLTEDRTNAEQKALVAWAWDCDRQHNKQTVTNPDAWFDPKWGQRDLVSHVMETRVLGDENDTPILAPKRWSETWDRWLANSRPKGAK